MSIIEDAKFADAGLIVCVRCLKIARIEKMVRGYRGRAHRNHFEGGVIPLRRPKPRSRLEVAVKTTANDSGVVFAILFLL